MHRKTVVAVLALVVSLMWATDAVAASPHFIRAGAIGPDTRGGLLVNFKVAGLDGNQSLTITTNASATALYACKNAGNNWPQDPKKQTVSGPVSASGAFTSGKNGEITGSLTLSPPPSTLTCPPGQRWKLVEVTYANLLVSFPNSPIGPGDQRTVVGIYDLVLEPNCRCSS